MLAISELMTFNSTLLTEFNYFLNMQSPFPVRVTLLALECTSVVCRGDYRRVEVLDYVIL